MLQVALGLVLVLLTACGQSPQGDGAQAKALPAPHPAPTRPERPAAWLDAGGRVEIVAVESAATTLTLRLRLPAGEEVPVGIEGSGFNLTLPHRRQVTCTVARYAVDGVELELNPSQSGVLITPRGLMRQWPVARLELQPHFWTAYRQRAAGRRVELEATLVLSLGDPPAAPAHALDPEAHPIGRLAARLVANPADLRRFEVPNPPLNGPAAAGPTDPRPLAPNAQRWLKVMVEEDGLYRIDAEALRTAGLDDPQRARLFSLGRPVPALAVDVEQGGLAAGVYFYGHASDSRYSRARAYFIADAADEPAMVWEEAAQPVDEPPLVERMRRSWLHDRDRERLLDYDDFLSIRGLEWVDAPIHDDEPLVVALDLQDYAAQAGEHGGQIELRLLAQGPPSDFSDIELELSAQGQVLGRRVVGSNPEVRWHLPMPDWLSPQAELRLRVSRSGPATDPEHPATLWLDWLRVDYPAVPRVEAGRLRVGADQVLGEPGPLRLALGEAPLVALQFGPMESLARILPAADGTLAARTDKGSYVEIFAAAAIPSLQPQAVRLDEGALAVEAPVDYLIIAHDSLMAGLDPLLDLNRRRGLTTHVLDIEGIYDLFGHGALTPEAIRAVLGHAAVHWPGGLPAHVLLLGDCNSDYLNLLRNQVSNLVPSYSMNYGNDVWASDYWFSLVMGEDHLPDLMLGRISVVSLEDARAAIAKIVRYAEERPLDPTRARFAYVADDTEPQHAFKQTAEALRGWTPPAFEARRVHLEDLPFEDNWYAPEKELLAVLDEEQRMMKVSGAATRAIRDAFDDGFAQLDFFGHGSPNIWCDERIWFGGDSPNRDSQHLRAGGGRLSFVVNYTCNTGAIDYPDPPWNICISEDLLRAPEAGAVGLFVPSGQGRTHDHERMARHWRRALLEDGLRGAGELALLARARYLLDGNPTDIALMFILLGDPALRLQLVERWEQLDVGADAIDPEVEHSRVARLSGLVPAEGQALAWIEDAEGIIIENTRQQIPYRNGELEIEYEIPRDLAGTRQLRLAVYGWNERDGQDWAGGAVLSVERPAVVLSELRPIRLGARGIGIEARLRNDGRVLASATLALELEGQRLVERELRLEPGEEQPVRLEAEWASGGEPLLFEAVLTQAHLPDDPAVPLEDRRPLALAGTAPNWVKMVPTLSSWHSADGRNGDRVTAIVMAAAEPTVAHRLFLQNAAGEQFTSRTLNFTVENDHFVAMAELSAEGLGRDHQLMLASLDDHDRLTPIQRVTLSELPARAPRMRIQPGSVRHEPTQPTEGDTIFIRFEVKNEGGETSRPVRPRLLDGPPAQNGQPLTGATPAPLIPTLAPGRVWPVTLRWDPILNAGVQKPWIELVGDADQANPATDQAAEFSVYVRSKWKLARTRPMGIEVEDREAGRYRFTAVIENSGETDARGVEVSFFTGPEKRLDQLMGRVIAPRVPAQGETRATLDWTLDRDRFPDLDTSHLPLTVEMRLLGSSQRIGG